MVTKTGSVQSLLREEVIGTQGGTQGGDQTGTLGGTDGVTDGLDTLIALTARDMAGIDELIKTQTASGVDLIGKITTHIIEAGGKRLRPMLTLACARMLGYSGRAHLSLAAAVELMHTATLLHDDVVDESDVRRGNPAARMLWGNQASVLVGDYLLGQAFELMVSANSLEALRILSRP